jgi:hypothetical protein
MADCITVQLIHISTILHDSFISNTRIYFLGECLGQENEKCFEIYFEIDEISNTFSVVFSYELFTNDFKSLTFIDNELTDAKKYKINKTTNSTEWTLKYSKEHIKNVLDTITDGTLEIRWMMKI